MEIIRVKDLEMRNGGFGFEICFFFFFSSFFALLDLNFGGVKFNRDR